MGNVNRKFDLYGAEMCKLQLAERLQKAYDLYKGEELFANFICWKAKFRLRY